MEKKKPCVPAWVTLWAWRLGPSSPKPGWGMGQAPPPQQPVTQEETALGPQTVKCQLQASGTRRSDLNVPGPSAMGSAAS